MKRLVLVVAVFLLIALFSVGAVWAKERDDVKNVVLASGEFIDRDYFASGDTVTVSGAVNGDVYVFGQKVVIDGQVNGDVIAAAGSFETSGTVSGDVRVAAGQVFIYGQIDGSLTAGSGSVTIDDDASIGRSVVVGAGSVRFDGPIVRGVTIGAGDATFNSSIGSSVVAGVGNIALGQRASINGNLNYWSENEASIASGALVSGETTRHIPTQAQREFPKKDVFANFGAFASVAMFVSTLILGFALIRIAPVFTQDVVKHLKSRPFASLGVGLAFLILFPIISLLLLVTVVGIPIALILLFATIVVCMFIKVFVSIFIGQFVQNKFKLNKSVNMALVVGLLIYTLFTRLPIIGTLVAIILSVGTFGAVLTTKRNYWKNLRAKHLI